MATPTTNRIEISTIEPSILYNKVEERLLLFEKQWTKYAGLSPVLNRENAAKAVGISVQLLDKSAKNGTIRVHYLESKPLFVLEELIEDIKSL